MPFVKSSSGFQIRDSDPFIADHNGDRPARRFSRKAIAEAMSHGRVSVAGPDDLANLQQLASDAVEGLNVRGALAKNLLQEFRPDVSIIVFTETHEIGHCLWQSIEPGHPLFHDDYFSQHRNIRPGLTEVYQEADRQAGR